MVVECASKFRYRTYFANSKVFLFLSPWNDGKLRIIEGGNYLESTIYIYE